MTVTFDEDVNTLFLRTFRRQLSKSTDDHDMIDLIRCWQPGDQKHCRKPCARKLFNSTPLLLRSPEQNVVRTHFDIQITIRMSHLGRLS